MSVSNVKRQQIISELINEIGKDIYDKSFSVYNFAQSHELTVQSVYRYLKKLEEESKIQKSKDGKGYVYRLINTVSHFSYPVDNLSEDDVWNKSIRAIVDDLSETAGRNAYYAFSEILNNAIDHSEGSKVDIYIRSNSFSVSFLIIDDGVGIFAKIASALELSEKRFAILELAKGKFTTAPDSHSGEGIFFSSKISDVFCIFSDNLVFSALNLNEYEDERIRDFILSGQTGTMVFIEIFRNHKTPSSEIFDRYTQDPDEYGFTKTIVPVRLLEYGDSNPMFVSRSQAKRLLVRFERFERIELDFEGIDEIGQGFADEVFRVFQNQHPDSKIVAINCNQQVKKMIKRTGGDIA